MHFLVTGGSGYLAQALGRFLIAQNETVTLASRNVITNLMEIPGCRNIQIDFADDCSISSALDDIDVVIHCAGINASDSLKNPTLAEQVNSKNTLRIIEQAQGRVKTFVYISTIHVYSDNLCGEITESSETVNEHPYALSHRNGEMHVRKFAHLFPEGAFSVRLANTFGIPINTESSGWDLVINDLCRQAVQKNKIQLNSNPSIARNFLPIDIASAGIYELVLKRDVYKSIRVFNLGADQNMTLGEVSNLISKACLELFGLNIKPEYPSPTIILQDDSFKFTSMYIHFKSVDIFDAIRNLLREIHIMNINGQI
jgi:UDP-glucose 4-epimerase